MNFSDLQNKLMDSLDRMGMKTRRKERRTSKRAIMMWKKRKHSPRDASRLQVVGECDIVGPNIELPLAEPKYPAEH